MTATTSFERPLRGALHAPAEHDAPTVVIAHGFKAFMGWGMFPWIADRLAAAGFAAIRFDFSCNGADENGDFTRLDLFQKNTYSREQADLGAILDAVAEGDAPFGGACRPSRIGVLGHSRGGAGVLLRAAQDERVAAVATMAATSSTSRFPPEARAIAERDGFFPIPNARTGQLMPVGIEAFRDADKHDILAATAALTQPLLVVHGTDDESVSVADGRAIAAQAGRLVEIEGATHTFGAVHPFAGPTPHLELALDAIVEFFGTELA
ncbi:MAG: alpha/beta hydrolase [Planctomycetota bacterium]|jgi:pimeloyl-ACP methyl ester carboxylesterase